MDTSLSHGDWHQAMRAPACWQLMQGTDLRGPMHMSEMCSEVHMYAMGVDMLCTCAHWI